MTYIKQTLVIMPSGKNNNNNFMSPKHVRVAVASTSSSSEKAESDSSTEHLAEVMLEDEVMYGLL